MQNAVRSIWSEAIEATSFPTLDADRSADAVIVGAGITGLSAAALLAEAGLSVLVVERNRVGSGTTGRSTAHLTEVLDVDYRALVSRFGADVAGEVARSSRRAIDEIGRRVAESGRNCGFERLPGFRLAETVAEADRLEREAEALSELGLDARLVDSVPVPFPCTRALRFDDQAQLQPLAYLQALAERVMASGGAIHEHAPVVAIDDDGVDLATGPRVSARHVIDAAHTPVGLVAAIQTRVTAYTSYVLAARLEAPIGRALCWDSADPYHYLRTLGGDASFVLVGGEDHRTGRERDPTARLAALEAWTRARFPVRAIETRRSHELFESADGLPYIGLLPGSRTRLVAAGFAGTGLTFGTVAALLLRDLVVHGASPWERLYSPSRLKPLASALPIAEETLRIGWRFVADRLASRAESIRDLQPDTGRVERIDGEQVAVYRDLRGDVHLLSPRCTHLGCIVAWNDAEKTWDCPCHGGRFHPTGKVLYGPPTADLDRPARGAAASAPNPDEV